MKVYVDNNFYTEKYLLGRKAAISEGFEHYALIASQVIRKHTFGRVDKLAEVPECVQMCCCELAEAECFREQQRAETGAKTSEKIGTYSVTYQNMQELDAGITKKQRSIVLKWLADSGLCYKGVR